MKSARMGATLWPMLLITTLPSANAAGLEIAGDDAFIELGQRCVINVAGVDGGAVALNTSWPHPRGATAAS